MAEELGWDRPIGRLLVVDYVRPQHSRPEGVIFVFDGGVLHETDVARMVFPDAEISTPGATRSPRPRHGSSRCWPTAWPPHRLSSSKA